MSATTGRMNWLMRAKAISTTLASVQMPPPSSPPAVPRLFLRCTTTSCRSFPLGAPTIQVSPVCVPLDQHECICSGIRSSGERDDDGQTSPINTFIARKVVRCDDVSAARRIRSARASRQAPAGAPSAGTQSNCTSSSISLRTRWALLTTSTSAPAGSSTSVVSFAGLYDQHCGLDTYDTPQRSATRSLAPCVTAPPSQVAPVGETPAAPFVP